MFYEIINDCIRATVLPSSFNKVTPNNHNVVNDSSLFDGTKVEEYFVLASDSTKLSTVLIEPKIKDEELHILHFLGSSQKYELVLPELISLSNENKCKVITFNYRGVEKSTGIAKNLYDLFNDGLAQVEQLIQSGVAPRDIVLSGFSLGGGIATKVAHHYHKLGERIYLFNDRSFGKLSKVAGAWYGNMFQFILEKILKKFDWDLEADKLYLQIPEKYRRHINLAGDDDEVVPFYVSLSQSIEDLKHKVSEEYIFHCIAEFKKKGHKAPLDKIINKYGDSGGKILKRFISEIKQQITK